MQIGGQDCFYESSGAYTGAVSTEILREMGASYVLIGHSERRTIFKEDDATINKKVKKVSNSGSKPTIIIKLQRLLILGSERWIKTSSMHWRIKGRI